MTAGRTTGTGITATHGIITTPAALSVAHKLFATAIGIYTAMYRVETTLPHIPTVRSRIATQVCVTPVISVAAAVA